MFQVRYLNKKFREEGDTDQSDQDDHSLHSNGIQSYGELSLQSSWQSNIPPVLPVPSTLGTPKLDSRQPNGHTPADPARDKNNNKMEVKKKRRSLKSLFSRSSKKKKKDKPKKNRGILYDARGDPLYDSKGNPLYNSDDEDEEVRGKRGVQSNGLDDSGYTSVATPIDIPPSLNVFHPPNMAHIKNGYPAGQNGINHKGARGKHNNQNGHAGHKSHPVSQNGYSNGPTTR